MIENMYEALLQHQVSLNPGTTKEDWAIMPDLEAIENAEDEVVFTLIKKALEPSGFYETFEEIAKDYGVEIQQIIGVISSTKARWTILEAKTKKKLFSKDFDWAELQALSKDKEEKRPFTANTISKGAIIFLEVCLNFEVALRLQYKV